MPAPKLKLSEADLCRLFIQYLAGSRRGWTAYPETADFDILLTRREDGSQIGIEAKLTLNSKAISQVLPPQRVLEGRRGGPDYRAILVPAGAVSDPCLEICAALGVTVIQLQVRDDGSAATGTAPELPAVGFQSRSTLSYLHWHDWSPAERLVLPDYIPDVRSGVSGPTKLTPWKIRAIKLSIILEERAVTPADFRALGLSLTHWIRPRQPWLVRRDRGVFIRGPHMPNYRTIHPRNYEEIRADRHRWYRAHQLILAAPAKSPRSRRG